MSIFRLYPLNVRIIVTDEFVMTQKEEFLVICEIPFQCVHRNIDKILCYESSRLAQSQIIVQGLKMFHKTLHKVHTMIV